MTGAEMDAVAGLVGAARRTRAWVDRLPPFAAAMSIDDAYAIQAAVARASGRVPAGWKIGATSASTQALLGTPAPIFGRMFADTIVRSPAVISGQRADIAIVEAEFAFTMGRTLEPTAAGHSTDAVLAATATMCPALEYIGSVFVATPGRPITDIIVDNSGHGGLVTGDVTTDWSPAELPAQPVRLEVNGHTVAAGDGSAVLGNPVTCLVWLANELSRRGIALRAGEIVTTGTCTGAQRVDRDAAIRGDFGRFGEVVLRFAD